MKIQIDNQINNIVYFGLIVKKKSSVPPSSALLSFSALEQVGNLSVLSFCFDHYSFYETKHLLAFMDSLDVYGVIFDNFKWKLAYDALSELKQQKIKPVDFIAENSQHVQLYGYMDDDFENSKFWKQVLEYVIEYSDHSARKDRIPFPNFQETAKPKRKSTDHQVHAVQQPHSKSENPQPKSKKSSEQPPKQRETESRLAQKNEQMNLDESLSMSDEMRKIDDAMKEIDDLLNDPEEDEDLGKNPMKDLMNMMDTVEQEIDSPHLKQCTKSDQERIHL